MPKPQPPTKRPQPQPALGPWPQTYAKLLHALASTGWICQGTVLARSLRRRRHGRLVRCGPYYLWTCKRKGKTLCKALSKAQYAQPRTTAGRWRSWLGCNIRLSRSS